MRRELTDKHLSLLGALRGHRGLGDLRVALGRERAEGFDRLRK